MPTSAFVLNGSIGLLSNRQMLAANGSYFVATNPTLGTGVVWATLATQSATANGLFVIANTGSKTIYLDRLKLKQTATAPTATLSMNFEAFNETGLVTGTGNVATRVPVQINTSAALSQGTGAVIQAFSAGAITIPAAAAGASRRLQDTAEIATGLTIVKDTFILDFGQDGPSPSIPGITAARATVNARMTTQMGPVVVAPNTTTWINMWWDATATNVPSFEYALSYIEI